MGAFQIIFVAVNLIVPYWIYKSRTSSDAAPAIQFDWNKWEYTMGSTLLASGGFNCPVADVMRDVRDLCQKSEDKWDGKSMSYFEQAIGNSLISCGARGDGLDVQISRPDTYEDETCMATDRSDTIGLAPIFEFNLKGLLRAISFTGPNNDVQKIKILSCRKKLKRLKGVKAATFEELVSKMGSDPGDPPDQQSANHLCVVYDPATGWNPWRRKFQLMD